MKITFIQELSIVQFSFKNKFYYEASNTMGQSYSWEANNHLAG
jgi:hypothetical protein